ncbi:MAG: hypothetical protein LC754_18505 [Acidobacteria bacterium]|nr:hypothetical protein [Acidobacteriota bacterium]
MPTKKTTSKTAAATKAKTKAKPTATRKPHDELDLSVFPPGTVVKYSTLLCLACIFDLFTKQLGLSSRTASNEIKRYAPTLEELTARESARPFFKSAEKHPRCPYCDSAKLRHARLDTYRIEGGKATDATRRALVKSLPKTGEQFHIVEEKSSARAVFFGWLDALGRELDLEDDRAWMMAATRLYLERRDPKTDWAASFDGARQVRRSQRLEEGFEREGTRLFLAPALYNDVLLVQYLVSRSHRHGGRTFEGRLTLPELVRRMRYSGHLDAQGITERDQFDVLEKLVEHLAGGDSTLKLHYIVDRRDLLDKVKTVTARYAS